MLSYVVRYCRDNIAIKRLKHIMRDYNTNIDTYIEKGEYILFFNIRYGNTLLLVKKKDNWLAVFKTNYTKREYIYCLLAARVICKNVHMIVNDTDIDSLDAEARLLNEAGYRFKVVNKDTERCDAFSKSSNIDDIIPKDFTGFIIKPDNRIPVSIIRKQNIH